MKKGKRGKAAPQTTEQEVISPGMVERNVDTPTPVGSSRITIFTSEDGGIDWDKSKPGADDELLNAITTDPVMLEKIANCPDFQDGAGGGDPSRVTNEEAGLVLDALTMVEGVLFSGISKKILGMKIDSAVISEHFVLTEKDHVRQDPPAAEGLTLLQNYLELDPKWRWIMVLGMAHAASLFRNVKNCVFEQYTKKETEKEENPATRTPVTPVM